MFRSDLYGSLPGFSAASETYENHFRWGRDWGGLIVGMILDGAARDAGNTPTSVLRPGLLLGQVAATGEVKEYSATATDGTDLVAGVLMSGFRMVDLDGNNKDRFVWVLAAGPVQAARLIGLDEYARARMAGRFIFDDRAYVANTFGWRGPVAKTADYTVVSGTDNNTIFTTQGAAGAVNFTLPATIAKGQRWRFIAEANQNLTVTAPSGKLVAFNNLAATSIAYSTSSEKVGSGVEVIVNADASKYIALPILGAETATPTIA